MRRCWIVVLLLLLLPTAGHSLADTSSPSTITSFNGYCFGGPYTTLLPCASPTPTRTPLTPVKSLSVGNAIPAPDGTTTYPVRLTSQLACFSLDEPIEVSTLGSTAASALTALDPTQSENGPNGLVVRVDPDTGQATLSLEVVNAALGAEGLALKAVWPLEQVEHIILIATPSVSPTPATSPTAGPTATPSATPIPTPQPFAVRACTIPQAVAGSSITAGHITLYGRTAPGATCTPQVTYYLNGQFWRTASTEADRLDAGPQVAGEDGLVLYPFVANTVADFGIATVTCSGISAGPATACTAFLIAQHVDQYDTTDLLTEPASETRRRVDALTRQYCSP